MAAALKVGPAEVLHRLEALLDERRKLERELADARKKLALGGGSGGAADEVEEIGGTKFLGKVVDRRLAARSEVAGR